MKIKTLLLSIFICISLSSKAQTKKLIKNFKFGTVGYNLYTLTGKANSEVNDTTFYILYRVGNKKFLAKEIKEVTEKSSGNSRFKTTYQIFSKSILFQRASFSNDDANRKYTQNSKGLLTFNKYGSPMVVEQVKEELVPKMVSTDCPEVVDILPEYPGGINNARAFIARHIEYPDSAAENEIQGTVMVSFIIEKDGAVTDIKINKSLGYGCDEEVIRVIKKMPKWSPGKLRGDFVRCKMSLPVSFRL